MALVKIVNDIALNLDSEKQTVLVLLDLSAAFDTVDHQIILERLKKRSWLNRDAPQVVLLIPCK